MKKILLSIVKNKCPKCLKGNFFINSNPYYNFFFHKGEILKKCSNCNFEYELEPGFFWGSMYVNYALSVFFGIIIFLVSYFILKIESIIFIIILISLGLLLLIPFTYYLGRLIWLNFFAWIFLNCRYENY